MVGASLSTLVLQVRPRKRLRRADTRFATAPDDRTARFEMRAALVRRGIFRFRSVVAAAQQARSEPEFNPGEAAQLTNDAAFGEAGEGHPNSLSLRSPGYPRRMGAVVLVAPT